MEPFFSLFHPTPQTVTKGVNKEELKREDSKKVFKVRNK